DPPRKVGAEKRNWASAKIGDVVQGAPLDEEGTEYLIAAMERVDRFEEEAQAEGVVHDLAPDVGPFLVACRPPMILIGADGSRARSREEAGEPENPGENALSMRTLPDEGLARRRARAAIPVEKLTDNEPGISAENMRLTCPDCR
ncbi:MAG TPA: hypothetical protein VKP69_16760, partial [Isosphaeraceae bacterium]|nr:hypothetical protein [Isosphaeraceae bacterium]